MAWIKLQIHPEHDKVLALADLTGANPERCFAAAVRWFRWADEHAEDASIGLSRRAFREVTRWKCDALAEAMLHERVDWLTEADGILSPTRWETHMSRGAKVRALDNARKRRGDSEIVPDANRKTTGTNRVPDQTRPDREEEKDKTKTRSEDCAVGNLAGWPSTPLGVLTTLGLREPLLGLTAALKDLTAEECARVGAAVSVDSSVGNKAVVTAARLFAARGEKVPATGKRSTLSVQVRGVVSELERIRQMKSALPTTGGLA